MSVKRDKAVATHERLPGHDEVKGSSDRSFGIVFAAVFGIVSLWPLLDDGGVRWWSLVIALVFAVMATVRPGLLAPLNRLWFWFGMLLHKIVNPLVMGLLFFATVTPIALIFRLIGKDPLNQKPDKNCETYWIERDPDELVPESMRNQF